MWKSAGVPRLYKFYPGICLTTKENARENLSLGKRNLSQVKKNLSESTVYILPKHPHITFISLWRWDRLIASKRQ
jgi:hypothetical protein